MPIRQKASEILDVAIRSGRWVTYAQGLDREGRFDRRKMIDLIMALCEEVEVLELKVAEIESNHTTATPEMASIPTVIVKTDLGSGVDEFKAQVLDNPDQKKADFVARMKAAREAKKNENPNGS